MLARYLEEHKSITPLEALNELGIYRLSARIADLRGDGYVITTERITVKNKFGQESRVARYSL